MTLNTCLKFEEPINLYHGEWLIPSEPILEFPPALLSIRKPQGNDFPSMEVKKQCIC